MTAQASAGAAPASPADAAARRRTFAIISHPDAGKTTLTEKLLLMGGAIRMAGQVRARGQNRRTRSDWMKIERERGISVSSAVMTFEHEGVTCNLLDTPGHEDFSEDTYRTLTAADSAVMVLDAARGIEPQTLKLFEVCRLRDIPIMTFVNKMDREARDPFELLDEIADKLALDVAPMMWPAGSGGTFRGCLDLASGQFLPFGREEGEGASIALAADAFAVLLDETERLRLGEEAALVREVCPDFNLQAYRDGHLTPVYFGSALRNFGVGRLLGDIARLAPPPRAQAAEGRVIEPGEEKVSGFVFKVQANMDQNHRDRVAFLRLVSGRFRRGMRLKQSGTGRMVGVRNPILFFAQDRELADEAWPGDIIGIPNHGILRVGDTLSEFPDDLRFTGIPNFAPEILRRVRPADPMKAKHMRRALEGLAEEGVTQLFRPMIGSQWIVGVVGQLQLEVLADRMQTEYGLDIAIEAAPWETARWIAGSPDEVDRFTAGNRAAMAEDRDGAPVFLARNPWEVNYTADKWPAIRFSATRERV